MKKFILCLGMISVSTLSFAGGGGGSAGDGCTNAVTLTPGVQQCATNSFAGDFDDASAAPTNPCTSLYNDGEYWFTYTGTGQALQLDVTGLTGTYSGLFVFDDCPNNSPTCVSSYTSGSSTADFSLSTLGLTNGQTYYIVMINWSTPYQTDFCLDATEVAPPTPPGNDDCSAATSLTVNADLNCGVTTAGTVELASGSADPTAESCFGTADDDVWYTFVATGTQHEISLLNVTGSTSDLYHSVYAEGMGCPSLGTEIECSDPNSSTLTGLTAGTTYYVRVYSYTSTSGQNTDFDICVGTPPPPPSNDECTGAISLTVNSDQSCGTVTSGTVASATGSTDPSSETCFGTADDDVWYSFVATGFDHRVSLINISGSTSDMYHAVFEEGSMGCPSLGAEIICNDGNTSDLSGLTPGGTYYVRVYTYTSSTGQTTNFDICIGTPAPPTCNDGIQNQDETYVDCGGSTCPACPPMYIPTACSNTTHNLSSLDNVTFYDDGGPGGEPCTTGLVSDGSYCNCNCFTTITICGASGEYIVADFREFSMWNTTSGWDWMRIYDGNNTSGTVLYDNSSSGPDNPFGDCGIESEAMDFCSSGQCLTFEFWATSTVNRAGWDALVTSVADQCVVPTLAVDLKKFEGKPLSAGNLLTWETIGETDHDYFIVQALQNNKYEEIGRVEGKGSSKQQEFYSFLDENPRSHMVYRLAAVDKDGKREYMKAINVKRKDVVDVKLHPNPTNGQLFMQLTSDDASAYTITIQDVVGKTIEKQVLVNPGSGTYAIKGFDELANGVYIVSVISPHQIPLISEKVIKE